MRDLWLWICTWPPESLIAFGGIVALSPFLVVGVWIHFFMRRPPCTPGNCYCRKTCEHLNG